MMVQRPGNVEEEALVNLSGMAHQIGPFPLEGTSGVYDFHPDDDKSIAAHANFIAIGVHDRISSRRPRATIA
jgi:hypothetical protein